MHNGNVRTVGDDVMQSESFVNLMAAQSLQIAPEAGMGCTILMWSDRHAATIIEVRGRKIAVQRDKAARSDDDGISECQSYTYKPDIDASVVLFSLRRNHQWVREGDSMRGQTLLVGHRKEYHDYSF